MKIEFLPAVQFLANYGVLLGLQLLVILLLRIRVHDWLGALMAYRLWLLPLLWLPFSVMHWSLPWPLTGVELPLLPRLPAEALASLDGGSAASSRAQDSIAGYAGASAGLLLFGLWLTGASILGLSLMLQTRRFTHHLTRFATPCQDSDRRVIDRIFPLPARLPVCFVPGLPSPALFGLLRPRLLLPDDFFDRYDANTRFAILAHEVVHYRRHDNAFNALAALAVLLFWFNPLVHFAVRRYRQDQELSCDALALRECSPRQRSNYARALIAPTSGNLRGSRPPMVSSGWDNPRDLKERVMRIGKHAHHGGPSCSAKLLFATLALLGSLASTVFAAATNEVPAGFMEADIIPAQYIDLFPEDMREDLAARDEARDPIPADSAFLVFIIDTSGSMYNWAWDKVLAQFEAVLDQYPDLEGFQVINDMGEYLLPESAGRWLTASLAQREEAKEALADFNAFSNSSPLEGIDTAVSDLVDTPAGVSLFILSDEFTADISPTDAAERIVQAAAGARVHVRMLPTILLQDEAQFRGTGYRFAELMLQVTQETGGSFVLVE